MHPGAACVAFSAPVMMVAPDVKRITSGDGVIRIAGEFDGAERVIHMDLASHDGAEPSVQGHSIGRWEDGTLIIDTTHFADHALGNFSQLPSGPQKHLVERLRLSEDGTRLSYHFELADPEYLAAPVSIELEWAHRPDLAFAPEACDPENARRFIGE
jgi:hypothetical protein